MTTLEQAIDRLYTAFADVPKPLRIDGCPCCIENKNIGVLLSAPLRGLTPDALSAYASSAFLTVGALADYLYFLPRILEISCREPAWWPDIEVTGRAIKASAPDSWPPPHRSALLGFLHAVINWIVESGEHYRIDEWLCAIARMGLDVRPLLDQVAKSPPAVLAYFEANARCLPHTLCNAFWELPCAGHDNIVQWFRSEPIRKIPLEAYGYVM